jgi:hypothetical protein
MIIEMTRMRAPRSGRTTRSCALVAAVLASLACGDRHEPSADTVALAELIANEAVPVFPGGRTAELRVSIVSVGGTFDSVFRAEMSPVVQRLRGVDSAPPVVLNVTVTSLQLRGDSAHAVVRRHGYYRADTSRYSSSDTRYHFVWERDRGWTLTDAEPFNFAGEGVPPSRARDVWWPEKTRD